MTALMEGLLGRRFEQLIIHTVHTGFVMIFSYLRMNWTTWFPAAGISGSEIERAPCAVPVANGRVDRRAIYWGGASCAVVNVMSQMLPR